MAQVHQAKLRVTCDLEIPQYQTHNGIEIELSANGKLLGEIQIQGAHVYYRRTRNSNWSSWTFSDFAKILEDNKNA